jgi:single-strand DNA-binding protein
MMNEAHISLTGYVASEPRIKTIREGVQNLSMRVAWTPRWLDRATGEWTDGSTSYVSVTCWRKLADNVAVCLRKGDPVVVKGRLSVRSYDDKQGVPRTSVDVDATSIGHDLCRGVALFQRTRPATGKTAAEYAAELVAEGTGYPADAADPNGFATDPTGFAADSNGFAADQATAASAAGAAALTAAGESGMPPGADGMASREMFDEDAIAALASETAGAAAPFGTGTAA